MQTDCNRKPMEFARIDRRKIVGGFDGGEITSDAGALLLGAPDDAIGMVARFAGCFRDKRAANKVVHEIPTMVGQRVFAIALGYEDIADHDELRHDPVLGAVPGRLEAKRQGVAPLAGKSTLNRLEHAPKGTGEDDRYHRIGHDAQAIETLLVDLFLDAHDKAPREIVLDLDATDDPLHGRQEGRFFHGYYDCYCYLPLYIDAAGAAVPDLTGGALTGTISAVHGGRVSAIGSFAREEQAVLNRCGQRAAVAGRGATGQERIGSHRERIPAPPGDPIAHQLRNAACRCPADNRRGGDRGRAPQVSVRGRGGNSAIVRGVSGVAIEV